MSAVKQVAVFAENRPGQTARLSRLLADARINIRLMTITSVGAFGVMKFVVNNYELAHELLRREGYAATLVDVLALEVPDEPGALHGVAQALADRDINIENTSSFATNGHAVLILEVSDLARAAEILAQRGIRVLSWEQLRGL